MNASRPKSSVIAWVIVLALIAGAIVGYGLWFHATTGPLCRAGPNEPGLVQLAGLAVLGAVLAGVVGAAFRLRGRVIAAQVGAALVVIATSEVFITLAYVAEHNCFD